MDGHMPVSTSFLKNNLLALILGGVGVVFGVVGIFQIFFSHTDEKIRHIKQTNETIVASESIEKLVIDVSGAVNKPGVYSLEEGARVTDAIKKAGGFSANADGNYIRENINLAAKITDGEKIFIPEIGEASVQRKEINTSKISLNRATLSELDSLPGIGEVTANKIVEERPFGSINELVEKKIVSNKVFEKIKAKLAL